MADQDPKITLLRSKLALLMGREECPVYDSIKAQHPHALEEPWSEDMSGPHKRVVFNNKTFAMHQVLTQEEAYKCTFQPHAINCGENIKLHLDDNLFRDLEQAETMDLSTLKRSEAITRRAVKSKWFYALTGWVNEINGGPGKMGPSPSEKIMIEGKEDASMSSRKPA
ncbi:hypothetical protein HO173_011099 [Letharia columbiana]|uniref:Uncharacterized protein n=1 Tax=Letharia columbiana TaxID=112416 RepID=A0A8H6FL92_9LECA|nr:uncharacterized protein HO173_011099 [Letharia columbiana]KAF6230562.1 hypothetical protein HO173_011099 [Letharia columbiana]